MIIILIILAIYFYLYYKPYITRNTLNDWIFWYNERIEESPGKFITRRNFKYLRQFKL